MDIDGAALRRKLRKSGLSAEVIDAAWPSWWSDEANESASARAELCFAVARKLGVSPKSLFDEHVEFTWRDHARFKHGKADSPQALGALESFGVSVGRHLIGMLPMTGIIDRTIPAIELRNAILDSNEFVSLKALLTVCWAFGVPVVHLKVFPLAAQAMHAMIVRYQGRYAIMLARNSDYPAPIAFTLAHEIGHMMLGHLDEGASIVDFDPDVSPKQDNEEIAADEYALTLLTGMPRPTFELPSDQFNSAQLAQAISEIAVQKRIEPGTLALCYAHETDDWPRAMASLKFIYPEPKPVWSEVNGIAVNLLDWTATSDDTGDFVRAVIGLVDA